MLQNVYKDMQSVLLPSIDIGGGTCFCPCMSVCLSVCLSVSKITQERVYGFG